MIGEFIRKYYFFPFIDVTGFDRLNLARMHYNFLVERLEWGLKNQLEDGGFITVKKSKGMIYSVNIYPAPDEFKELYQVHMGKVHDSAWFNNLLNQLIRRGERIGLEYHTHAIITEGREEHEEYKTIRRGRAEDLLHDRRTKEDILARALARTADLIIERTNEKKVNIMGFIPLNQKDLTMVYEGRCEAKPLEVVVLD